MLPAVCCQLVNMVTEAHDGVHLAVFEAHVIARDLDQRGLGRPGIHARVEGGVGELAGLGGAEGAGEDIVALLGRNGVRDDSVPNWRQANGEWVCTHDARTALLRARHGPARRPRGRPSSRWAGPLALAPCPSPCPSSSWGHLVLGRGGRGRSTC